MVGIRSRGRRLGRTRARALVARPWELGPGPCAGLLLLHALMAHSRLPRMPAAWLDIAPRPGRDASRRGARVEMARDTRQDAVFHAKTVPRRGARREPGRHRIGRHQTDPRGRDRDRETAARLPGDVVVSRLVGVVDGVFSRGGTSVHVVVRVFEFARVFELTRAVAVGSALGPSASVDGPPRTRTTPTVPPRALDSRRRRRSSPSRCCARSSTIGPRLIFYTPPTCHDSPPRVRSSASAAGMDPPRRRAASRPAAAAVLELVASVLIRGAPGETSSSATAYATESHALYVAHRLLQTQVARGGRPLVFRWDRLWEGVMCALRRCAADEESAGLPRVVVLASQAMNLASFSLTRRGELCSRPDDILPLVEAFVTEEATFAKIAAGAAKHGYLVDADDGRRARAAANLAGGKRRAGVRVETVAHVQARLRGAPRGKLREAARQALFTLDPPIRDGLEAGWALAATPNGDARGGGLDPRRRRTEPSRTPRARSWASSSGERWGTRPRVFDPPCRGDAEGRETLGFRVETRRGGKERDDREVFPMLVQWRTLRRWL